MSWALARVWSNLEDPGQSSIPLGAIHTTSLSTFSLLFPHASGQPPGPSEDWGRWAPADSGSGQRASPESCVPQQRTPRPQAVVLVEGRWVKAS